MDIVHKCDEWSRIDRPNGDYSGLVAYESARSELLDIARTQVSLFFTPLMATLASMSTWADHMHRSSAWEFLPDICPTSTRSRRQQHYLTRPTTSSLNHQRLDRSPTRAKSSTSSAPRYPTESS